MEAFLLRALLGGLGVAAIAGPLGCFVVWRRMAYFGATLSHAALLGVALGFALHVHVVAGVIGVSLLVSLLLVALRRQQRLAGDTLMGILAHSALAFGLVVLAFMEDLRLDLMGYLFGDILAISWLDVGIIGAGGVVVLGLLALLWRPLLSATVHEDLARVEGVNLARTELAFMLLLAVVIAVSMKIVGILLVTSMLIIPAAVARHFARSPEQMAVFAAVAGMLAVLAGLGGSLYWDTPAGPSVVVAATGLFALSLLVGQRG